MTRRLWLPVLGLGSGLGAVCLAVAAAASGRPVGVVTLLSIGFGAVLGAVVAAACLASSGRFPTWGVHAAGILTGWLLVLTGVVLTVSDPWSPVTLAASAPGLIFGLAVSAPLSSLLALPGRDGA